MYNTLRITITKKVTILMCNIHFANNNFYHFEGSASPMCYNSRSFSYHHGQIYLVNQTPCMHCAVTSCGLPLLVVYQLLVGLPWQSVVISPIKSQVITCQDNSYQSLVMIRTTVDNAGPYHNVGRRMARMHASRNTFSKPPNSQTKKL